MPSCDGLMFGVHLNKNATRRSAARRCSVRPVAVVRSDEAQRVLRRRSQRRASQPRRSQRPHRSQRPAQIAKTRISVAHRSRAVRNAGRCQARSSQRGQVSGAQFATRAGVRRAVRNAGRCQARSSHIAQLTPPSYGQCVHPLSVASEARLAGARQRRGGGAGPTGQAVRCRFGSPRTFGLALWLRALCTLKPHAFCRLRMAPHAGLGDQANS
jgi:hypothetical protein